MRGAVRGGERLLPERADGCDGELRTESLGELSCFGLVGLGEDHDELIAAVASDGVADAYAVAKDPGDLGEDLPCARTISACIRDRRVAATCP